MKSALLCALSSAASFLVLAVISRSAILRDAAVPEPPHTASLAPPAAASTAPSDNAEPALPSLSAQAAGPESERFYERHEIRGREHEFEIVADHESRPFSRALHVRYRMKKSPGGP